MTKRILLFLVLILLKAEFSYSAFSAYQKKDTLSVNSKISRAKQLIDAEKYSESLNVLFTISSSKNIEKNVEVSFLIGNVFRKTENYKKAISYYKKSLNLNTLENTLDKSYVDENLLVYKYKSLLSLSATYLKQQQVDSATYYLDKLVAIKFANTKTNLYLADAYSNLSGIYLKYKRNHKEAANYIKKAIDIHKNIDVDREIKLSSDYINLASIYADNKEFLKAKKFYLKSEQLIKDLKTTEAIELRELLYDNLAWTLYKLKDYKAFEYLDKSVTLRDELRNEELKKELKKIEIRHNVDLIKKEEENKRLILQRNNWLTAIIGISASLLFLIVANFYRLRQENLNLELSKKELEQQKNIDKLKSESQVKIINATIDGKETERKEIAEILHDNVSALLSSANMHLEASQKQFGDNPPTELQKTQQIILEASQKIRDLSHNLISSVLLKFGLEFAVKDMAKKYSNSEIKIHVIADNVKRYTQGVEVKVFNIIQELINNVLKHSKANKTYVLMEGKEENLFIVVKDNGVGFQVEESKDGIGLNQIKARIKMMNGTFNIESGSKTGTKISIDIPVIINNEAKLV